MLGYVALNRSVSVEAKECLSELADSVKDFPPDSVAVTAFKKWVAGEVGDILTFNQYTPNLGLSMLFLKTLIRPKFSKMMLRIVEIF